jgi:hypothetical protein
MTGGAGSVRRREKADKSHFYVPRPSTQLQKVLGIVIDDAVLGLWLVTSVDVVGEAGTRGQNVSRWYFGPGGPEYFQARFELPLMNATSTLKHAPFREPGAAPRSRALTPH